MEPAHFIAVDHKHKALVISFRGTMDITNDALADVVCDVIEWHVRNGIASCPNLEGGQDSHWLC